MSTRVLLGTAAIGVAALIGCAVPAPRRPIVHISLPERIRVRTAGKIIDVPLEEYVLGSALSEIVPLGETAATTARAFEVQAVLARTYAVSHLGRHRAEGFDLCDGTHCEVFQPGRVRTSRFSAAARAAVLKTAGLIVVYGQRPAEVLFHADCGGVTASADQIWGGPPVPYLSSTPDDVAAGTHRTWKVSMTAEQLRTALNGDARSRIGRHLTRLTILRHDGSGRALELEARGDETRVVRGEELRAIVNQRLGDRGIQSTRFSVHASNGTYIFEGTGYGHGVGLCQVGALSRARAGAGLDEILLAYFKGAAIGRADPAKIVP